MRLQWVAPVTLSALLSVGCLTSTPPANDASASDPQNSKGTGARDLTDATPGASNPGTGEEGGPGSTGKGIGAGSGTGTGSPPAASGPATTPAQGAGPGAGPGAGAGH
jgi:hypothetical protein